MAFSISWAYPVGGVSYNHHICLCELEVQALGLVLLHSSLSRRISEFPVSTIHDTHFLLVLYYRRNMYRPNTISHWLGRPRWHWSQTPNHSKLKPFWTRWCIFAQVIRGSDSQRQLLSFLFAVAYKRIQQDSFVIALHRSVLLSKRHSPLFENGSNIKHPETNNHHTAPSSESGVALVGLPWVKLPLAGIDHNKGDPEIRALVCYVVILECSRSIRSVMRWACGVSRSPLILC